MKLPFLVLVSLGTFVAAKQQDSYRVPAAVTAQVAPGDAAAQQSAQSTMENLVHTLDSDEMDVEIEVNKDPSSGPLVFSISSDDHSCSFSFDSLQGQSSVSESKFAQINGILFGTNSEIPDNLKENAELMQQIDCFRFLYDSLVAANSETSDAIRDFIVSQFYSQFMQESGETATFSAFNIGPPAAEAQWLKVDPLDKKTSSDELLDSDEEFEDEFEDDLEDLDPSAPAASDDEYTYQTKIGYINKVGLLNNFDRLSDVEYIGNIDTVSYIDDLREIDNVGSIDKVEHIENIQDIKHTGNIKNIVNVGIIREIDSLDDIKNIDNINKIENIKNLDSLDDLAKIEYIDNIESIKNVESLEDVQNINNVERINNIEEVSIFAVPGQEAQFTASGIVPDFQKSDIENVELIENIEKVENLRNLENIGYIEDIKNIETVEHSKNMLADNVGTIENIEHVVNIEEMLPPAEEEAFMDWNEDECDGKEDQYYYAEKVSMQALPDTKPALSKHQRPIFVSKGSIENIEKVKNVEHIDDPSYLDGVKHIEKINNVGIIDHIDNPKDVDKIEVIENVEVIKNINTLNSDGKPSDFEYSDEMSDYSIVQKKSEVEFTPQSEFEPEVKYTGLRVQKVKQANVAAAAAVAAAATAGNGTTSQTGTVIGNGATPQTGSTAHNGTTSLASSGSSNMIPTALLVAALAAAL